MSEPNQILSLGGDFPPVSEEHWRELVDQVLTRGSADVDPDAAGARFERLVTTTYDGLRVEPLYTASMPGPVPDAGLPGLAPYTRGTRHRRRGWDVRQRVVAADDDAGTALQIRDELERGTTSILLDLTSTASIDADRLDAMVDGVHLELMTIALDADARWRAAADALAEVWSRRGLDPGASAAVLGADPVGVWAARGGSTDLEASSVETARWAALAAERFPNVRTVLVDGSRLHECGAGEVDELAYALALGVHHLRTLTDAGLGVDTAAGQLEFRLAATPDQFSTIAKLRAARRLWHRAATVAGVADTRQRQHAVTSRAATARYGTWVNVLRSTVACFAAGVGGADAVTVLPHDDLLVPGGSSTGRRLARNTQLVLVEESNIARVADMAGGSWYVEHLTEGMAQAAWAAFQDIERAGGIVPALRAGVVQEQLARTRDARQDAIAHRRHPLTGVTEFPDVAESPPPVLDAPPELGDPMFEPLRPMRYADAFEHQRGRADRITARAGRRPEVFLVTLGPPAAHTTRATFAKNLFESGGIRAVAGGELGDGEEAAAAFRASGAPLACICSSDRLYADLAVDVARAVAAEHPRRLYLAGRPSGLADDLRSAGVDEQLVAGGDVLAVVTRALDAIEEA